jgi:hypothetical protein
MELSSRLSPSHSRPDFLFPIDSRDPFTSPLGPQAPLRLSGNPRAVPAFYVMVARRPTKGQLLADLGRPHRAVPPGDRKNGPAEGRGLDSSRVCRPVLANMVNNQFALWRPGLRAFNII